MLTDFGKHLTMRILIASILASFLTAMSFASDHGELIFLDDFERNESQEAKEELTNGWGSNSEKRANGNKQVDLKEGAMHITFHPSADHAVSVTHEAEFRDGAVQLRFMLPNKGDNLGLNFADLKCKEVHAGHLFLVRIYGHRIVLQDLKTGNMDLETRKARQAKTLTKEQKKVLEAKQTSLPHKLEPGQWYEALAQVQDDSLTISIDGQKVGSFTSPGIAHPTKRMLRLSVPSQAVVDDVKIWRAK